MASVDGYNHPAFFNMRNEFLSRRVEKVICPAVVDDLDSEGEPIEEYSKLLARAFRQVLASNSIAALPGWDMSEGATAEVLLATLFKKKIYQTKGHYLCDAIMAHPSFMRVWCPIFLGKST